MLTITTMFIDSVIVDTTIVLSSQLQIKFACLVAVQHKPYNAVLLRTFRVCLFVY